MWIEIDNGINHQTRETRSIVNLNACKWGKKNRKYNLQNNMIKYGRLVTIARNEASNWRRSVENLKNNGRLVIVRNSLENNNTRKKNFVGNVCRLQERITNLILVYFN